MGSKTRLIVLRRARTDVNKIPVYIGDRNLDAGIRFLAAAKEVFERLRTHPGIGSLRQSRNKRLQNIR